jgi:hypothetical protein
MFSFEGRRLLLKLGFLNGGLRLPVLTVFRFRIRLKSKFNQVSGSVYGSGIRIQEVKTIFVCIHARNKY